MAIRLSLSTRLHGQPSRPPSTHQDRKRRS